MKSNQDELAELKRAKKILSEQNEDCLEMNRMVKYAQCVTIRDQQLLEKKEKNK